MKCWFHPEARIEFLESVVYYESHQTDLGRRFLEAVMYYEAWLHENSE